jgi:uncharacterized LabA/DUF88 family protein
LSPFTVSHQNTIFIRHIYQEDIIDQTAITISQSVAILVDGNNVERSLHQLTGKENVMVNFDVLIPKLLENRGLNRLVYFREGKNISKKFAGRLHSKFHGTVVPCHKSADIPLSIYATQIAEKVDTIIILSGDSDYVELVSHLKSRGVRVEIAAVEASTAAVLKEEADYFTPIEVGDSFVFQAPGNPPPKRRGTGERR